MNEVATLGKRPCPSTHQSEKKKIYLNCFITTLRDLVPLITSFLDATSLLSFEATAREHVTLTSLAWKKLNEKKSGLFFQAAQNCENVHRANYFIDKLLFAVFKKQSINEAINHYNFLIQRLPITQKVLQQSPFFQEIFTNSQVDISGEIEAYTGEPLFLAYMKLIKAKTLENDEPTQAATLREQGLALLKDLMHRISAKRVAFIAKQLLPKSTFFNLYQDYIETLVMEENEKNHDELNHLAQEYSAVALHNNLTNLENRSPDSIQQLENQASAIYHRKESPFYYFFIFKLKAALAEQDPHYFPQAEQAFDQLMRHYPKGYFPEVLNQILFIKIQSSKWDEAEAIFDQFSLTHRPGLDAFYYAAVAKSSLKKHDEAEVFFNHYFQSMSGDLDAGVYTNYGLHKFEYALQIEQMGGFSLAQQKFIEAVTAYEKAAEINYSYFTTVDLFHFGNALIKCKKWREADRHYSCALEIEEASIEKNLSVHDYRVAALVKTKLRQWNQAEALCEKILPHANEDITLLSEVALVKFSNGKPDEARYLYNRALLIDPKLRAAFFRVIVTDHSELLEMQFNDWDSLYYTKWQYSIGSIEMQAFNAIKEKRFDDAIALADKIAECHRFSYQGLFVSAYLRMRCNRWDLAEALFDQAFSLLPPENLESKQMICAFLCQAVLTKMQLQKWEEANSLFDALANFEDYLTSRSLCDTASIKIKFNQWKHANDLFQRNLFIFNTFTKQDLENFILVKKQLNQPEEVALISYHLQG